MYTGIIYKYTSPSGKSYIGQTIQTIDKRARFAGEGYKKCTVFYAAILKYGFDKFVREILHEVSSNSRDELQIQLDKLERQYISLYNTLVPNGYNIRAGGETARFAQDSIVHNTGKEHFNWRHDLDETLIQQLYQSGETIKSIASILNIAPATIQRHLKDAGILREKKYNCPVVKLNIQGEILARWSSASEAARAEQKDASTINRCCREKRRPHQGITYRYEGDEI